MALKREVRPSRPRPLFVTPWFVATWASLAVVAILQLIGVP